MILCLFDFIPTRMCRFLEKSISDARWMLLIEGSRVKRRDIGGGERLRNG